MPKYKVLVGQHIDNHPLHGGDHVYAEGDLVETDKDLCRFNAPGMQPKFERLHEDGRMTREEWEVSQKKAIPPPTAPASQPTAAEQPTPQPPKEAPAPAPQQPVPYGQRQQGKGR